MIRTGKSQSLQRLPLQINEGKTRPPLQAADHARRSCLRFCPNRVTFTSNLTRDEQRFGVQRLLRSFQFQPRARFDE